MKKIGGQEALAAGLSRYYTGIPCKRGHISERFVKNRLCVQCTKTGTRLEKRRSVGRNSAKKHNAMRKLEVLSHYSDGHPQCRCCGETEVKMLTVDHKNNNGSEHQKKLGKLGVRFYRWLVSNGFPPEFQVLCFNCNVGRHLNAGVCPHRLNGRGRALSIAKSDMTVKELQRSVSVWADSAFGGRTVKGTLTKLMCEELPEFVLSELKDPLELADVFILALDIATQMGIDVQDATTKKLAINRKRKWSRDPDTGFYKHV